MRAGDPSRTRLGGARPGAGGDGTREYGGGNMPTSAVCAEDQQRSHHQRDREANLVEHSTSNGRSSNRSEPTPSANSPLTRRKTYPPERNHRR